MQPTYTDLARKDVARTTADRSYRPVTAEGHNTRTIDRATQGTVETIEAINRKNSGPMSDGEAKVLAFIIGLGFALYYTVSLGQYYGFEFARGFCGVVCVDDVVNAIAAPHQVPLYFVNGAFIVLVMGLTALAVFYKAKALSMSARVALPVMATGAAGLFFYWGSAATAIVFNWTLLVILFVRANAADEQRFKARGGALVARYRLRLAVLLFGVLLGFPIGEGFGYLYDEVSAPLGWGTY